MVQLVTCLDLMVISMYVSKIYNHDVLYILIIYQFTNIGDSYTAGGVPYVGMRSLSALLGALTIPVIYGIMRESGHPVAIAILSASIIMFGMFMLTYIRYHTDQSELDNGHVAQTRLILLDAALVFFMALSLYCYVRFSKTRKKYD